MFGQLTAIISKAIAFARRNIAVSFLIGVFVILSAKGASGQAFTLSQTFPNPNPEAGDNFGVSVALSNRFALIGEFHEQNTGARSRETTYLFDTVTGKRAQTFSNPASAVDDGFGWSVALSENLALIGAFRSDSTAKKNSGAAYLFSNTNGKLLQTFLNPTPKTESLFGYSVALSKNFALVSAVSSNIAYLFDVNTGRKVQTFYNPTPEKKNGFGSSVSLSNNFALIGAYQGGIGDAENSGAAYLFNAITGQILQVFINPTPKAQDLFGSSVALSGNYALIGAIFDDTNAENSGAAYLFNILTGKLLQTFINPTPTAQDNFGGSVALSGNYVCIGASNDHTGNSSGAAYLFDITTGNLLHTFSNPNFAKGNNFGSSVALSGNKILIGSIFDNTGARNSGAAYLFTANK
ncbi:MAG: hypothetical protein HC908_12480 [Calothrix sp. SM1_7_51]|nr:hypothetical protein [Calothrix sp. SM1_7_51]